MLEPYEAKVSRTVLRRVGASNCSFLFGGRLKDLSFTLAGAHKGTPLLYPIEMFVKISKKAFWR